jgi:hypothetical protein
MAVPLPILRFRALLFATTPNPVFGSKRIPWAEPKHTPHCPEHRSETTLSQPFNLRTNSHGRNWRRLNRPWNDWNNHGMLCNVADPQGNTTRTHSCPRRPTTSPVPRCQLLNTSHSDRVRSSGTEGRRDIPAIAGHSFPQRDHVARCSRAGVLFRRCVGGDAPSCGDDFPRRIPVVSHDADREAVFNRGNVKEPNNAPHHYNLPRRRGKLRVSAGVGPDDEGGRHDGCDSDCRSNDADSG